MAARKAKTERFKLSEDEASDLDSLIQKAGEEILRPMNGSKYAIRSIWEDVGSIDDALRTIQRAYGRDSEEAREHAVQSARWMPPRTGQSLAKVNAKIIVESVVPGVPGIGLKPLMHGAVKFAEDQKRLNRIFAEHGNIKEAIKRALFVGLMNPHFGILYNFDKDKEKYDRGWIEAIEGEDCGQEPQAKRFSWYSKREQWSTLPEEWRKGYISLKELKKDEHPKSFDMFRVTRVFHKALAFEREYPDKKKCPVSIFMEPRERIDRDDTFSRVGEYVATDFVVECPLVIDSTEMPAPGEYVSSPEVLEWIPIIRMMIEDMNAINLEVATLSRIRLFNKQGLKQEEIENAFRSPINGVVWLGIAAEEYATGVSGQVRPIEKDSNLSEMLAVFNHHAQLLGVISGVNQIDYGDAPSPQKSATEAGAIVQSSRVRRKERLEIVSRAMGEAFRIHHAYQREVYGNSIELPDGRKIDVPDPKLAPFVFRVDPIELGHLDLREDLSTNFTWLQVLTNVISAFPQQMPAIVRDALANVAEGMGHFDALEAIAVPEAGSSPQQRMSEFVIEGQVEIRVEKTDDPMPYVTYYMGLIEKFVAEGRVEYVSALTEAVGKYELMIKAQSAQQDQAVQPPQLASGLQGGGAPGGGGSPFGTSGQLQI